MLLALSKVIPVRMTSTYSVVGGVERQRSTWWQWRGRVLRHRVAVQS